ncbi:PREDICTED: CD151 antigen-like isoform X2 [Branchiostoma belcheri]|uniref:CD151 antigen-like isoform X2 n=1 Tax=Branchiostoma belcheri TaxID=7741 RepID=A0A6P4XXF4_BRABE|nr:PREDICTED: CD151 antigen-like isoform X2 [Branchiostoma belcheri]
MERFWPFKRHRDTPCCSYTAIQFTLFFSNFVFWTGGMVSYVVVWALKVHEKMKMVTSINLDWLYLPLYVTNIVIGVIMYFGCCAAFLEQRKSLLVYAMCLVVLILAEVSSSTWALIYTKTEFQHFADKSFNTTIQTHGTLEQWSVKSYLEEFQTEYQCCGLLGQTDWREPYKHLSCKCGDDVRQTDVRQTCSQPCGPYIKEYLTNTFVLLGIAGLVFGHLQLFGIFLACWLYRHPTTRVRTKRRRQSRAGSSGNTSSGLYNNSTVGGCDDESTVLPVSNGKDRSTKKNQYLGNLPNRLQHIV